MGAVELSQNSRQIKPAVLRKCLEEGTGYLFIGRFREENRPRIILPAARRDSDHCSMGLYLLVHESDSSIVIKHGLETAGAIVQRLPRSIPCKQMMVREALVIDIPRGCNVKIRPKRGDPGDLTRQHSRRNSCARVTLRKGYVSVRSNVGSFIIGSKKWKPRAAEKDVAIAVVSIANRVSVRAQKKSYSGAEIIIELNLAAGKKIAVILWC